MLATRPILLYTLIQSRSSSEKEDKSTATNAQTLKTLGDACTHAARHTHSLIVEEWTNGSVSIYGYFYAHYLFSCALIMVISSEINTENCNDFTLFETAIEILRAMSDHGNLAATEFYDNLEEVRRCLDKSRDSKRDSLHDSFHLVGDGLSLGDGAMRRSSEVGLPDHPGLPEVPAPGSLANEMAFLGQGMEEFLALPDVDFGPLDPSGMPINVADAVYSWPNYSLWSA